MKAAVLHAPHDLRLDEVEIPRFGPADVLIRVTRNGLCGTDLTEFLKGPMMVPLNTRHPASGHQGPTILGHEFIGVVADAGDEARHLIGKRVACGAGVSCGECDQCAAGRRNLCVNYYTLGLSTHGGLAEFAVSPANICYEIDDCCPDDQAVLAQPLAVGIHSSKRANLQSGDSVAILGFGAIGSFIGVALSEHQGCVAAFDINEQRLELAHKLGITETHLIEGADMRATQTYDVVFETSGVPGALKRALSLVRTGGTIVLVGLNNVPEEISLATAILREINFVSTVAHVAPQDMKDALAVLTQRPELADLLVDCVVPLDNIVSGAMDYMADGKANGKVVINTDSAPDDEASSNRYLSNTVQPA